MQTRFTAEQLRDPDIAAADAILRKCVHCGFCTATCPTYLLLGDELDSPRGRIYLIKDMLERGGPPPAETVKHLDRCLTCLSCTTTCPSGVDYMHLVDLARSRTGRRPVAETMLRGMLARVLPHAGLFRLSLFGARLAKPFAGLLPGRLRSMVEKAPGALPPPSPMDRPQVFPAGGEQKRRVALMTGCAQKALRPAINEATIRLLTRHGCEVVVADSGCCGALALHMGLEGDTVAAVKRNVAAWEGLDVDAVVVNASGCGTTVKDYGHILRAEPAWKERADRIAALARDLSEVVDGLDLEPVAGPRPVVACHVPCSLQHGQKLGHLPRAILERAGFTVREPRDGHLCCGSAGTYGILQLGLSAKLKANKAEALDALDAEVVATANVGCLEHLEGAVGVPVVHWVELIDRATANTTSTL